MLTRSTREMFLVFVVTVCLPAHAQLTAPVKNNDTTITVTGKRESTVEMSNWRMAETPHVVVFSQNDEKDLRDTAHNLEKLHFALSTLLGRVDAPDETIKIAVTMIGDAGGFEQLRLTDLRWQYGPFPHKFEKTIYYDPREEGSVLATTREGVNLVLRPSVGRETSRNCEVDEFHLYGAGDMVYRTQQGELVLDLEATLLNMRVNELAFCQSADSRLYAAFAQHYLMTYFPAAYPRWFLQGFGEIFATMKAGDDFVEYGHMPSGFFQVMEHYGSRYPVTDVFEGRYLLANRRPWTPHHAWRLVHLLYFSEAWKPRLHRYLADVARGVDPKIAASAFGDPGELQNAVANYRGKKLRGYERMTFPPERAPTPTLRQLTRAEAGLVRGRLELGARIEVPVEEGAGRSAAIERRADWLARLRKNASQFPKLIEHQLLLAEAECRSNHPQECLAAAERALALSPREPTALVWQGTALAQLATSAPAGERERRLKDARKIIAQANRLDPEGVLPLIAFYNSFAVAGESPPDNAVDGLIKVVESSPAAPSSRLRLGEQLIKRGLDEAARDTLLPVANGAFDTPERQPAAALLPAVDATGSGD